MYRKTIVLPNGTGDGAIHNYNFSDYGITNVAYCYISNPSFYTLVNPGGDFSRFNFNYYDGSKYTAEVHNNSQFRIQLGYQYIWGNETVITIEYTKTTD